MNKKKLEAKTIETYNVIARQWTKSHGVANDWKWAADRFRELLPSGRVLEIGCGGGRDAAELIDQGYEYFGTDASRGMIGVARMNVPSAAFECRNIYNLASLHTQFDGFWACAILLHIPKERINEAFRAISAVLKLGAKGMISIKDGDEEEFEVRDSEGMHEERLFVYWRKEDFTRVLSQNGFSVLEYTYRPVNQRTNWHTFFVEKQKDVLNGLELDFGNKKSNP